MDKQQDALRKLGRRLTYLRQQQDLTLAQLATRTGIDSRELVTAGAGAEFMRAEMQGEAHLGDLQAAELQPANRMPFAD